MHVLLRPEDRRELVDGDLVVPARDAGLRLGEDLVALRRIGLGELRLQERLELRVVDVRLGRRSG